MNNGFSVDVTFKKQDIYQASNAIDNKTHLPTHIDNESGNIIDHNGITPKDIGILKDEHEINNIIRSHSNNSTYNFMNSNYKENKPIVTSSAMNPEIVSNMDSSNMSNHRMRLRDDLSNSNLNMMSNINKSQNTDVTTCKTKFLLNTVLASKIDIPPMSEILDLPPNIDTFTSPHEFEMMVNDMRKRFLTWMKKVETNFSKEKDAIMRSKEKLEQLRKRLEEQIEFERKTECDKLFEEKRQTDMYVETQMKLIEEEKIQNYGKFEKERIKMREEASDLLKQLNLEKAKFLKECEFYEATRKKIHDAQLATETQIEFNIGGTVFSTSRNTIDRHPGSLLNVIISGRHRVEKDKYGRIFFDRDAELFRVILNYLRDPLVPPCPTDIVHSDALCKETDFYDIKFFTYPLCYAFGGHNGIDHLRSCEVLDPHSECWRQCKAMQLPRVSFASACIRNRIYAFGGRNLDYGALVDTEVYDVLLDDWINVAPMITARRHLSGTALNERIFAIGGFDGNNVLSNVEAYDARMRSWHQLPPLPNPRCSAAACAVGEKIYVCGGTTGNRLKSVDIFDTRAAKWLSLKSDMLQVRSGATCVNLLGNIVVCTGTNEKNDILSSVEMYDASTSCWKFLANLPEPRMDAATCATDDNLIITGGHHRTQVLKKTNFYYSESNSWHEGPNMIFPRYGHQFQLVNI